MCTPGFPVDQLEEGIAEAKRLRRYLTGDFYVLSDVTVDPTKWCVYQWHRRDLNAGIVFAFRRHESPYQVFEACLRGIDEHGLYEVSSHLDHTELAVRTMPGWKLWEREVLIPFQPGSYLLEYRGTDVPAA